MGRKIPAKKHRGVKDPLVQQAKRLECLKGKINAPPKDPDEQPVPRSLIRLFGLEDPNKKKRNVTKNKATKPIHKKNIKQESVGSNPVRGLRRAAGESGRDFSLRISSAIRALHSPAGELQYPQDLEADDTKGLRMAELRERRARKRRRGQGGRGVDGAEGAHLTRTQKLAAKKKARKVQALEAASAASRELSYERVSFGDVAHAPPALRAPRAARAAPRPGRRDLLLTKMLEGAQAAPRAPRAPRAPAPAAAELLRRERARLDAIAAYRALNKHKHKNK